MSKVLKTIKTIVVGGRELRCESCGNDFTCGVSLKGCWCSGVEVSEEARASMRSQFKDCLCRDCLENKGRPRTDGKAQK